MTAGGPPTVGEGLPNPGDLLAGKYRIDRMIGRGGMGIVFSADYEILAQRVAIKLLLADIAGVPEAVQRFHNEARAAAQIQSEHVARVMELGTLDTGVPFMVMEYLEGDDLGQLLKKRGPLSTAEAVDYVLQALEAVGQAHARGIVHRDLKPANLFLAKRHDGSSIVKVLDFGISKATNPLSPGSGGMTSTKAMLGSPYYMSPEQLRSSRSVTTQTDIWSMGVILHELLVGSVPFLGENIGELFSAILEQLPPPVRTKRPDVDPDLEQIILRCLQRNPAHRFAGADELSQALVRHASARGRLLVERAQRSPGAPTSAGTNPHAASVYMPQTPPMAQSTSPDVKQSAAFAPAASAPGMPIGPSTAAAWGHTGTAMGVSKRPPIVVFAAPVLVALGLAVFFVAPRVLHKGATTPDAGPLPVAVSAVELPKPPAPPVPIPVPAVVATPPQASSAAPQPIVAAKSPTPPATPKPRTQPVVSNTPAPIVVPPSPPPTTPKPAGGIPGADSRH